MRVLFYEYPLLILYIKCVFVYFINQIYFFTFEVKWASCHRGEHKPEKVGHLSTSGGVELLI